MNAVSDIGPLNVTNMVISLDFSVENSVGALALCGEAAGVGLVHSAEEKGFSRGQNVAYEEIMKDLELGTLLRGFTGTWEIVVINWNRSSTWSYRKDGFSWKQGRLEQRTGGVAEPLHLVFFKALLDKTMSDLLWIPSSQCTEQEIGLGFSRGPLWVVLWFLCWHLLAQQQLMIWLSSGMEQRKPPNWPLRLSGKQPPVKNCLHLKFRDVPCSAHMKLFFQLVAFFHVSMPEFAASLRL